MKFYKAFLETINFTFAAYEMTEDLAMKALIKGLEDHGKQYGLETDWFKDYVTDIYIDGQEMGKAYRDNEEIRGADE